jgi:hypothetical protein
MSGRDSGTPSHNTEEAAGTQFTCCTGAKVQILTQLRRSPHLQHSRPPKASLDIQNVNSTKSPSSVGPLPTIPLSFADPTTTRTPWYRWQHSCWSSVSRTSDAAASCEASHCNCKAFRVFDTPAVSNAPQILSFAACLCIKWVCVSLPCVRYIRDGRRRLFEMCDRHFVYCILGCSIQLQ